MTIIYVDGYELTSDLLEYSYLHFPTINHAKSYAKALIRGKFIIYICTKQLFQSTYNFWCNSQQLAWNLFQCHPSWGTQAH